MSDLNEIIFTSDSTGQLWNSCIWNAKTGTSLMHYKGGTSAASKTLCILNGSYLLSADSQKPLIHIWPLNSQEQVHHIRFVTPGKINVLTASPDGRYCIGAIDEKIYIWQIETGRLLTVLNRHYQKINCLQFIDTGSHFISAGEDSMLMVWSLSLVISVKGGDIFSHKQITGQIDPIKIYTDHSLPVTDVYVGKGGVQCRFISVSLDRTCKIYDFASQTILLSIVFDAKLTACTMNHTETLIFVGCDTGDIYEFSLVNPPRVKEHHVNNVLNKKQIFKEHIKRITCLSVSLSNETLLSGSDDGQILLWNIPSKNYIRSIPHKGSITNGFFSIAYSNIFAENLQSNIILHNLQRNLEATNKDTDTLIEVIHVDNEYLTEIDNEYSNNSLQIYTDINDSNKEMKLRRQIEVLKKLNRELYQSALKNIVQEHVLQQETGIVLKSGTLVKKKMKSKFNN